MLNKLVTMVLFSVVMAFQVAMVQAADSSASIENLLEQNRNIEGEFRQVTYDEKGKQLPENIANLLRPAVSMIGLALSQQPVYKLSATKVQEALLKSADPNLVIKNNALVIELFD